MSLQKISYFSKGLASGAVMTVAGGLTAVYALNMSGLAVISIPQLPLLHQLLDEAWANLRLSLPFFLLLLSAFFVALRRLKRILDSGADSLARVVRAEQIVDLCIALFFGVGVIWTAVGMRSALLYAMGDPGMAVSADAFGILQRMVDGGILLALSSTIVGGMGGYLMRMAKMLNVGGALHAFHERRESQYSSAVLESLHQIEQHLRILRNPLGRSDRLAHDE